MRRNSPPASRAGSGSIEPTKLVACNRCARRQADPTKDRGRWKSNPCNSSWSTGAACADVLAGWSNAFPPSGSNGPVEPARPYFDRLHVEAKALIGALSDADLERKCQTPAGTAITTWKWLRAMCEHEAHHRGQIYLMLNLLEVPTPPLYGLTSEAVRERSVP